MKTLLSIGLLYLALGIWCAINPEGTSKSLGFVLSNNSAHSEYFTVYGGLDLGLGIGLLLGAFRAELRKGVLVFALTIHASLVVFRSISFLLYSPLPWAIYILATLEIAFSAALFLSLRKEM